MSRAISLTQKQVTALCKGAAKAGFVAEVKIGAAVVRLVPASEEEKTGKVDAAEDIRL